MPYSSWGFEMGGGGGGWGCSSSSSSSVIALFKMVSKWILILWLGERIYRGLRRLLSSLRFSTVADGSGVLKSKTPDQLKIGITCNGLTVDAFSMS